MTFEEWKAHYIAESDPDYLIADAEMWDYVQDGWNAARRETAREIAEGLTEALSCEHEELEVRTLLKAADEIRRRYGGT